MIRGKTKNGFEYTIEDDVMNDWELLEIIDGMDENPQYMVRLAKRLLGSNQYDALKKHCSENCRVSLTVMTEAVTEILNSSQETKN